MFSLTRVRWESFNPDLLETEALIVTVGCDILGIVRVMIKFPKSRGFVKLQRGIGIILHRDGFFAHHLGIAKKQRKQKFTRWHIDLNCK